MAKHADGPKSGRRGHGYKQARAAGAPNTAPRTDFELGFWATHKRAEKKIRQMVQENAALKPVVEEMIKSGMHAIQILYELESPPSEEC